MTTTLEAKISLTEFLKLPETKPASEFIDGRIYQKPMPKGKHSRLQSKLCNTVNEVGEGEKVALAFTELRCTFGGRSIVPDVVVFEWERVVFDEDGEIADSFLVCPDWVIEIFSPEQSSTKVIRNILHFLKYGCKLGWLIDPEESVILVFLPHQEILELVGEECLPVPDFIKLNLTVSDVFNWLKPVKLI
ncbi:MAG TPA: Uma2 family endonuclease [Nostocaceae cyanobacterium]|nr:Uma2 family endonuclease [Nostocaceae cyanobacterium]